MQLHVSKISGLQVPILGCVYSTTFSSSLERMYV